MGNPLPKYEDLFIGGTDGYPVYRIPALLSTSKGTLLAVVEGRKATTDQSENDINIKRSFDGGNTWEPQQVVLTEGRNSFNNPCLVEDERTRRIFMMVQKFPDSVRPWDSTPGYDSPTSQRNFIIYSDDEGLTWSNTRDITRETKFLAPVTHIGSGPGRGIQIKIGTHAGRLIYPMYQGPVNHWQNYCVYSDDGGEHWLKGDHVLPGPEGEKGNEPQLVELSDGRLLMNARGNNASDRFQFFKKWRKKYRRITYSSDGGHSWSPLIDDRHLIEPRCMAGFIRYSGLGKNSGEENILLFSNPASNKHRSLGRIRMSYDEGLTWPKSQLLCNGRFGYSSIARLQDSKIGVLFETGVKNSTEKIRFAAFDLKWLSEC